MKQLLSAMAMGLTLFAFLPYMRSIIRGSVRPHVFSWIIWGATTLIVFLAQLQAGGGAGAWAIGMSACLTIFIAGLACRKRGDISISLTDWGFLVAALSALPVWYATADPLWAVVILTVIDVLGFGPTFRKSYARPYSESQLFYGLFALRNGLVIMALEHYSPATLLFPAVIAGVCISLMVMISLRRYLLAVSLDAATGALMVKPEIQDRRKRQR